jgi:hypothetical protein
MMKKFQLASSPRGASLSKNTSSSLGPSPSSHCCYSLHHHPVISNLYSTHLPLLNKLILLNTATLESLKNSLVSSSASPPGGNQLFDPKTNADHEHTQALILSFFKTILYLWGHEIGENDDVTLQALTGPYLAQLVQSCLVFSQHRSTLSLDTFFSSLD